MIKHLPSATEPRYITEYKQLIALQTPIADGCRQSYLQHTIQVPD